MQIHLNTLTTTADQLAEIGAPVNNSDMASIILTSLPNSYEALVVALELRPEDEITLEFVKSRLLQEATKRTEGNVEEGDDKAFFSHEKGRGYRGRSHSKYTKNQFHGRNADHR